MTHTHTPFPDAAQASHQAQSEMFMKLWTLKEAVVKARGLGINAYPGLKHFAVGE